MTFPGFLSECLRAGQAERSRFLSSNEKNKCPGRQLCTAEGRNHFLPSLATAFQMTSLGLTRTAAEAVKKVAGTWRRKKTPEACHFAKGKLLWRHDLLLRKISFFFFLDTAFMHRLLSVLCCFLFFIFLQVIIILGQCWDISLTFM